MAIHKNIADLTNKVYLALLERINHEEVVIYGNVNGIKDCFTFVREGCKDLYTISLFTQFPDYLLKQFAIAVGFTDTRANHNLPCTMTDSLGEGQMHVEEKHFNALIDAIMIAVNKEFGVNCGNE